MTESFIPSSSAIAPHNGAMMSDPPSSHHSILRTDPHSTLTRSERLLLRIPESNLLTICGGLAGAASAIVSCPLDVIKTKLQAQGGFRRRGGEHSGLRTAAYHGVRGTAVTIWTEEGVRGLYRGLGPLLLGYIPTWAVYLTVYNKAQQYFNTKTDYKFVANFNSALLAGTCSTLATNPVWVIKTRLMSQSSPRRPSSSDLSHQAAKAPWQYRNTADAFYKMYKTEGLRSFYSGLTPALIGLSHVAVQFPLYEIFKVHFAGLAHGERLSEEDRSRHFLGLSFSVFLSKVIASTATYPHEVVRTRLQTQQRWYPEHSPENLAFRGTSEQAYTHNRGRPPGGASSDGMINKLRYRGTIQTCKAILMEEGWRGFYAGLGTNLIRAVPSAMTTILTFEYMKAATLTRQRSAREKIEEEEGAPV